jgi:hypothetical protein
MEDYLRCNQLKCDPSTGFKLSQNAFDQGHGFIDYETRCSLFFGNNTTTYTNLPTSYKNKFSRTNLEFSGSYYAIDPVAIGGGLRFGHSVQKSNNNSLRYTTNFFEFDPEVTINAPVNNGRRNLFIKGGGYFGSNKT